MHRIGTGSFKTDDGESVSGSLVITVPEDGDYSPGRDIGVVHFVVDNPDEESSESKPTRRKTTE